MIYSRQVARSGMTEPAREAPSRLADRGDQALAVGAAQALLRRHHADGGDAMIRGIDDGRGDAAGMGIRLVDLDGVALLAEAADLSHELGDIRHRLARRRGPGGALQ